MDNQIYKRINPKSKTDIGNMANHLQVPTPSGERPHQHQPSTNERYGMHWRLIGAHSQKVTKPQLSNFETSLSDFEPLIFEQIYHFSCEKWSKVVAEGSDQVKSSKEKCQRDVN